MAFFPPLRSPCTISAATRAVDRTILAELYLYLRVILHQNTTPSTRVTSLAPSSSKIFSFLVFWRYCTLLQLLHVGELFCSITAAAVRMPCFVARRWRAPSDRVQDKHLPVYLRKRRRKPGEALIAAPTQFGLAELYLHRAEAFFQLVGGRETTI